ncbi:2'-5' RNA ligase [Thermincola potens JR]|uniref:RNA 2',3'-cyclic phosphodiesterase n=1 Tax=Thermincola potens (strain JR) TaxID=635013 RepID=D5XA16_THEPJ|nr:2'-5' RNA ligase [Thermincola potens JR]
MSALSLKRCFLAVPLSGEAKRQLSAVQESIEKVAGPEGFRIKWVERQNLHLTVKFFGDISEQQIGRLKDMIPERLSSVGSFRFKLTKIGGFPNLKNPNVLWTGVCDPGSNLARLHEIIDKIAEEIGLARDAKKYIPHLTLGRLKKQPEKVFHLSPQGTVEGITGLTVHVGEVILYESRLTPTGPVYKSLARFPLSTG